MTATSSVDGALIVIEELRIDAKVGKGRHFAASDRKLLWHRLCGIPVILANLFVGIVLLNLQSQTTSAVPAAAQLSITNSSAASATPPLPATLQDLSAQRNSIRAILSSDALALISVFLAFSAASLSGVQTFFNFYKSFEGHRAIGNRYTYLSRQCKALQQRHRDIPYNPAIIWQEYDKLLEDYNKINIDGESFPTSPRDFKTAQTTPKISPYSFSQPRTDDSIASKKG